VKKHPNKYDRKAKASAARFVQCAHCPAASGHAGYWARQAVGSVYVPAHPKPKEK
jgi:hypothetical protein